MALTLALNENCLDSNYFLLKRIVLPSKVQTYAGYSDNNMIDIDQRKDTSIFTYMCDARGKMINYVTSVEIRILNAEKWNIK